ncbi:CDP-6-deoxy-delta-3,4-glucoseen reductase [Massilia horti]|uniref:CDP-6-deoxy-delta-3,4-glucoseen reductase n=1 Tax=Massilia horti TaxID=2562153 RepID=A0A4Y9SY86_9BURK|nr:CDP-6-deoxy-delta-3,4-glucoseen reductase [Massilia horti]TFW31821.1 CDP-6-deoxy-delta-3,4-glucoseen reductase [Massilia horti]
MTFQITVQPSGHQFECEADETVLAAAIRAGIGLPYGCKNGACGSCKGKVIEGAATLKPHQQRSLPEQEKAQGLTLFCCTVPETDMVIEAREVAGSSDYPMRKMPTRVQTITKAAPDVAILTLQLPANEALAYRAGQYIEFLLKDGKRRAYSIANAPSYTGPLELHIRHMPGGVFTEHVFNTMKEREILRFEGPLGTFFLREDSDKPIVLLASGTGFAPVKALVEHLMHLKSERKVVLYWGGRRPQDLYMSALCEAWTTTMPDFTYIPVISDALPEDNWQGRTGFVHAAVMQDIPDLSDYQVYACGAPVMVDAARRDYVAMCNLPSGEFYADAFTSEADLAQP